MEPVHNFRTALCLAQRNPREAATALLADGWKARHDTEPLDIRAPINWLTAGGQDANWRFQIHSWRLIDPLIVARDRTQKAGWSQYIVPVMLNWADAEALHGSDHPGTFWNDMGTGHRAARLAYVLSLPEINKRRNKALRMRLQAVGQAHVAKLREPAFFSLTNHGFFQVHGLMGLALTLPQTEESEAARDQARDMFRRLMRQQFGQDGVHLEHSPGYHGFALRTLKQLLGSGWYDDLTDVIDIRDRALKAQPWFVFPNGRISAIGDSSRRKSPPERISEDPVAAKLFEEAGYAIVKSSPDVAPDDAFMLIVAAGHHSAMHKHADDLSFELFDNGRYWVIDSGRYTYSNSPVKNHMRSAAAHNSVDLIEERDDNGVRQTPPAGGMLSSLSRDGDTWVIKGAFDRPLFGVAHERTFRYTPGRRLVLEDHIRCQRSRTVTAWLHLASDLSGKALKRGWSLPGASIRYESDLPITLSRYRGAKNPMQGWSAPAYHRLEAIDALGATLQGEEIRLRTVIEFGDLPPSRATPRSAAERLMAVLNRVLFASRK